MMNLNSSNTSFKHDRLVLERPTRATAFASVDHAHALPVSSHRARADYARRARPFAAGGGADAYRSQRFLDLAGSMCALVIAAPLMVVVALAIRIESRGPALYRQTRVGRNGRSFTLLKFRSMYRERERIEPMGKSDRAGVCAKWRIDPRVTCVGRFIRKTSIDELPQLINIVMGDMALVGPRPALPKEVAAYSPRARRRLTVRPGLTGFWQVSGRADIGFDKMIDLDLAYIKRRSLLVDLVLIGLTVRACASGRGAY